MMKKKVYKYRNPKVGDYIEATSNPFNIGDQRIGYEYTIKELRCGYVVATGERMPHGRTDIIISDGQYVVFEYEDVPEKVLKETHLKEFKVFGITLAKRTKKIYKIKYH